MYPTLSTETEAFIRRLPKTETHLHIEGAVPYELLQKMDPEKFHQPQACWAPDFRWESFAAFEHHLIEHAMQWYTSAERYHEAAKVIFAAHLTNNVRYVELSFHAGMIEFIQVPGIEILNAIRSAVPDGLEVRIFMGMTRDGYTKTLAPVLEECFTWDGLAGIDLHGVESLPLETWTPRLWRRARTTGLEVKAHAGEFGPAANVRDAIETLGVRRIQHGTRAIEDPSVIDLALETDTTFDMCPISNVKLQVTPAMEAHPIRQLFDLGVRCTVSTDDPFSFGNTINDEYAMLHSSLNFTHQELAQIAKNGFEVALINPTTRAQWITEIEKISSDVTKENDRLLKT